MQQAQDTQNVYQNVSKSQWQQWKVRLVTIVVLIILAGITLNAVIGEDRHYFASKEYEEPSNQRNNL